MEELYQYYAPELMNRFFDTISVQKGLSKSFGVASSPSSLNMLADDPKVVLDPTGAVAFGAAAWASLQEFFTDCHFTDVVAEADNIFMSESCEAMDRRMSSFSSKSSSRAVLAMPGYISVYSCVSPAIAAARFCDVEPIGRPVAGSPVSSRYSRWPCAWPVSPSAVERNTAATSL